MEELPSHFSLGGPSAVTPPVLQELELYQRSEGRLPRAVLRDVQAGALSSILLSKQIVLATSF